MSNENSHTELIKCPECGEIQEAILLHTIPFNTCVHECVKCGHVIMESEWEKVGQEKEVTAMQELIDMITIEFQHDHTFLHTLLKFKVLNKATSLLQKEKQNIINARLSVTGLNHASPTDDNSLEDAEDYYNSKYTQTK